MISIADRVPPPLASSWPLMSPAMRSLLSRQKKKRHHHQQEGQLQTNDLSTVMMRDNNDQPTDQHDTNAATDIFLALYSAPSFSCSARQGVKIMMILW